MNLTVLVDNNAGCYQNMMAEPGLSFLLENDYQKILFDCGYSDIFIKNAYKMGLDLTEVTEIVLSHGHDDHTAGLIKLDILYRKMLAAGISLTSKSIYAHPDVFELKLNAQKKNVGYPANAADLCDIFDLELTTSPVWLTPKLVFLGEIPILYKNDYRYSDESAVVYKASEGLVIMVGCSHIGLQNIIEYAKKVTKEERILALIGGVFLHDKTEYKIRELGIYLRGLNIKNFYPCHCCDLRSKIVLSEYVKIREVYSGFKLSFD